MVNCDLFRKRLYDLQEGNISEKLRLEMEEHKKTCKDCCTLFDEDKAAEQVLREAFLKTDREFRSCREVILESIDKDKYGKKVAKRLCFSFRRNITSYILCAILLILFAIFYPIIVNMFNTGKQVPGNSNSFYQEDNNSGKINALIKVKESELPLPENTKDSDAEKILNKIKGKDMGSDAWTICYCKDNKVIFYNSPGLLAYTYDGNSCEYYGAVDLEKIGCNYMSGETVSMMEPSPDGNLIVIWNWDVEAMVNGNTNIYIYNLVNKKTKIFNRDNKDNIIGSWSKSSRYYAFGDSNGKNMTVYDAVMDETFEIPLGMTSLKQLFISDNGNAVVVSDKNYLIKNSNNKYVVEELQFSGDMLGFTQPGGLAYFHNGSVYEYDFTISRELKKIGNEFKLVSPYKLNGVRNLEHPMFSDGTSTVIYDLNGSFYTYNFRNNLDKIVNISDNGKKCFITSDFISGEVITSDGAAVSFNGSSSTPHLNYYFLNDDSLVRIIQKNNSSQLSDFVLMKYQLEK